MEEQRQRARTGAATAHGSEDSHEQGASPSPPRRRRPASSATRRCAPPPASPPSRPSDGRALVKLEESPFYAEGGGQVADSGLLRWDGRRGAGARRLSRRRRPGARGRGRLAASRLGVAVEAVVDRETRHATMRNHTATHLLHAALRERLGTHVRQAGSAVRPDKLRFDFTHGQALSPAELGDVEDRVNEWIKASAPVRWMNMERAEAEKLGAMALFGEKYGEWVRVVEVDGVSRELCGGTHVANTAEVGIFKIVLRGLERRQRAPDRGDHAAPPRSTGFASARVSCTRPASCSATRRTRSRPPAVPPSGCARPAPAPSRPRPRRSARRRSELAGAGVDLSFADGAGGRPGRRRSRSATDGKQLLDLANRVQSKLGGKAVVVARRWRFGEKVGLVVLVSRDRSSAASRRARSWRPARR